MENVYPYRITPECECGGEYKLLKVSGKGGILFTYLCNTCMETKEVKGPLGSIIYLTREEAQKIEEAINSY